MKPVFLTLTQGDVKIVVNMSQIAYMTPNTKEDPRTVLYFSTLIEERGEPLYLVVDESIAQIGARSEWNA